MPEITEREILEMKIRSTIEWHFGQICDRLEHFYRQGKIDRGTVDLLKSKVRKEGNQGIEVIKSHLEKVNISVNNAKQPINTAKIARQLSAELAEGKG